MNLFKYILFYSFICTSICVSSFSALEDPNNGAAKPIHRVPSAGDDSALGSDEDSRDRLFTPSPDLFAHRGAEMHDNERLFPPSPDRFFPIVPIVPPTPPAVEAENVVHPPIPVAQHMGIPEITDQPMPTAAPPLPAPAPVPGPHVEEILYEPAPAAAFTEEDKLLEQINALIGRYPPNGEQGKILQALRKLTQQKRSLIGLIGAYKRKNQHSLSHLFDDWVDQVRKNEDCYHEVKHSILKDLSAYGMAEATCAIIGIRSYPLEERCRNTVGSIAMLSKGSSLHEIFQRFSNRKKLIAHNRIWGLLQFLQSQH